MRLFISRVARNVFCFFVLFSRYGAEQNGGLSPCEYMDLSALLLPRGGAGPTPGTGGTNIQRRKKTSGWLLGSSCGTTVTFVVIIAGYRGTGVFLETTMMLVVTTVMFLEATVNRDAPSTARSLARDPRVMVGWPLPLAFGLGGRLLLARRRGRVYV